MPTLNIAVTAPVNPPGAHPPLTAAQAWAGLRLKIRRAHAFVPAITSCAVLAEDASGPDGARVVTRRVYFKHAPDQPVTEVCTEFPPSRVHFRMLESGSEVQNIISTGVDAAGDEALFMTYAFAWRSTGDAQSADEVEREREKQQQMAAMAVTSSIAAMRAMVLDGRINVTS